MKYVLRQKAVNLRKQGNTYSQILREIPVSRSTLSLWLRHVGLTSKQEQTLSAKKLEAIKRGGAARRNQKLNKIKEIRCAALNEINDLIIDDRALFLIGIMLYWAEGAKEKEYRSSQGIIFSNSDPLMIKVFLKWLINYIKVRKTDIFFNLYIHEAAMHRAEDILLYWQNITGFSRAKFGKIYLKKNRLSSLRKNTQNGYYGQIRIKVSKSSNLNRKIAAWIEGICIKCGVV